MTADPTVGVLVVAPEQLRDGYVEKEGPQVTRRPYEVIAHLPNGAVLVVDPQSLLGRLDK